MISKFSIKNIMRFLEDPKYPSLGPHLKILKLTGIWRQEVKSRISRFKETLIIITISYFITQYIKCCIYFNADSLKLLLQYAPFHMGILKVCFFRLSYNSWEQLIAFMSTTEKSQLAKHDKKLSDIINDYIIKNRMVTYFFWSLAFFSNWNIFSEPYRKNITTNTTSVYFYIFDGYTPFEREPPGYYFTMSIQTFFGNIVSLYVVGWDTLVVSIMIFFTGQLNISRVYCKRTIVVMDPIESHHNIKQCHLFHTRLIKYHKLFNSLISQVMFVYVAIISVNLGIGIIQIVEIHDDPATLMSACVFLNACIIQLLLFYWFSNEVTVASTQTSYGTFKSDWPGAPKYLQKEMALLALTTTKKLIFHAGPFYEMSLATFVAILKTSYSFYTILNNSNDNKSS